MSIGLNTEKLIRSLEKRLLREQQKAIDTQDHIDLIKKAQASLALK